MSSVDDRIVRMTFDNQKFEEGVKTTMQSLENLKKGLDFSGIQTGIESLQKRFSTMGIVGMEITRKITDGVISSAKKLGDATIGQIKQGGMRRALNIEQARFQLQGLFSDMKNADAQVDKVMGAALNAVRGTAYGLDEAAKSASVLAASGVGMKDMEPVLTSIAGAAAMTGRSYEDIGNIYSTVASNGKLMTMQLRQFSAAGLNVSAVLAKHYGKTEEQINEMVTKGEVSFKDFSEAMLSFGKQAKRANETFSGSLSNMKAALSRIGAAFASPYLEHARDIFNALTPAIDEVGEALKPFTKEVERGMTTIKEFVVNGLGELTGGKKGKGKKEHYVFQEIGVLTKGMVHGFNALFNVIKPLSSAFKEVFPKATIKNFENVIKKFNVFAWSIKKDVIGQFDNLKDGWAGLFTIFKAFGNAFGFVKRAIEAVTAPFGGLINIIGTIIGVIGRAIQRFYDFVSGSELISNAADNIVNFLGKASRAIHDFITSSKTINVVNSIISGVSSGLSFLGKAISSMFSSFKEFGLFDKIASGVKSIKDALGSMGFGKGFSIDFGSIFSGMFMGLGNLGEKLKGVIGHIAKIDFRNILDTGLITLVTASVVELTKAATKLIETLTSGSKSIVKLPDAIKGAFDNLKDLLKGPELSVRGIASKSAAIMVYASAIGILVLSVKALAKLKPDEIIKSIASITILFRMLNSGTSKLFENINPNNAKGLIKTATSLVIISFAIRSLAKAVKTLSEIKWEGLAKGLIGVSVLMAAIGVFLSKTDFQNIKASKGLGIIGVAFAINIMAKAVEKLGNLNVKQLAKGLTGIAVLLTVISASLRLVGNPKRMVSMGAGLVLLASSMLIFYSAVKKMGDADPGKLGQGLLGLTAVLAMLTATVKLMPGAKALAIGAALVVMSVGILAITGALRILGTMSIDKMGVGLLGIVGALGSLGLLAKLVNPVSLLATSAAIVVFAAGLSVLTPILLAFGKMKLENIGKALLMLVGVFTAFGLAALILAPVIPMMIALGAAIAILGAGISVTAAGLILLATAFGMLATSAAVGAGALVSAITTILTGAITMLPEIGSALAESVLSFITTLSEGAAKVTVAATKLGMALLKGIQQIVPQLVSTGISVLTALLQGIEANIELLTTLGVNIIAKFILGIARSINVIIQSGIALVFAFANGIAQGIRDNTQMVIAAAKNLMSAVIEAVIDFLDAALGKIPVVGEKISAGLAKAKEGVRDFFDVEEAEKMSSDYINGVSKGINDSTASVKASGENVGKAVSEPTTQGFRQIDKDSKDGVANLANNLTDGQGAVGDAASGVSEATMGPLRQTLLDAGMTGEQIDAALGQGMNANLSDVQAGAENITKTSNKEYDKATKTASKKAKEQSVAYAKALDPKTAANAAKGIAERVAKNLDAGRKTALSAGKNIVKEYSIGIEKNGISAKNAGEKIAKQGADGTNNSNAKSTANTAGMELGNGLVRGMVSKEQAAYQAGYRLGQKAAQGQKDGAKVKSPSRIAIQTGKFIGEGLVIGMRSMSNSVYNAGYSIGNSAANSLTDAMSKVYDVLNSDMDMNPTITPVLDLSNVNKGVRRMNGMLDTRKLSTSVSTNMSGLRAMSGNGYLGGNTTSNNTSNTFNIHVDGTENPELFADRLVRQIRLRERMS